MFLERNCFLSSTTIEATIVAWMEAGNFNADFITSFQITIRNGYLRAEGIARSLIGDAIVQSGMVKILVYVLGRRELSYRAI